LPITCHISRTSWGPTLERPVLILLLSLGSNHGAMSLYNTVCCCRLSPPPTRFHRFHHSARHCTALVWIGPRGYSFHSCCNRHSSVEWPNPGRKQKPTKLSQRASCSGLRPRPFSCSHNTSHRRRIAVSGQLSLFVPKVCSSWRVRFCGVTTSAARGVAEANTASISCTASASR